MGQVVYLESWAKERAEAMAEHPAGAAFAPVERLERAVRELDSLVPKAEDGPRRGFSDIETELLAIKGAVSLERYDEAAERAERLAARLGRVAHTP